MCVKVSVLFYTTRSDRKIKNLVNTFRGHCACVGGTSCLTSGHPLHRLTIHSSEVSLSKFRMLTGWYRVGTSSCSLNNIPLVPKLRLPLLRRHFCGVSEFHLRCCPSCPWFRTFGYFLACTYDSLRLSPIDLHNLHIAFFVFFGSDGCSAV